MRLCDSLLVWKPEDTRLNRCPAGPFRSTNPYRCLRCGGWLAHGRLLEPTSLRYLTTEATSILKKLCDDAPFVYDLAHHPTRRPQNGRSGVVGDPTGNDVADWSRARVHDYALIVCRLLEGVVRDLRHADDACGDALYAAEPPGPKEHTRAPYHDTIPDNRPDLEDAYAARDRRRGRGEAL